MKTRLPDPRRPGAAPWAPLVLAFVLAGCFDDSVTEPAPFAPAAADTVSNLFALLPATASLTATNVDAALTANTGKTRANLRADTSSADIRPFAYFDLDADSALSAAADTGSWDVAFRGTTLRIHGQYKILSGIHFDSLTTAPDTGYTAGASSNPAWYEYDGATHTVTPKPGQILVLRTADNKYAKLQVLSYYKNNPAAPAGLTDTARYYTFRYFVQRDGSADLRTRADGAPRTFFSLRTGQYADSTGQWDLALRTTAITFNGSYQFVTASHFDSVTLAPEAGYAAGNPAWYDYDPPTHTVTPKPGQVLVFKTADNKYAKLQILSYYKNSPASPAGLADTARYYTFKYFVQADGSRNLKTGGESAPFTFFSLKAGTAVADSNGQWDIAFRSTTIRVNGSSQLVTSSFDTLSVAPETGYAAGNAGTWYDYSGEPNHTITPKLGKVLVIRTVDQKYAKVEILSYYQNAPAVPSGLLHTARYYTFRYVYQADGTRAF